MDGKLIFTKVHDRRCAVLMNGQKLMAASFQGEKEKVTGGIYVARIRDVVKDLNACFAEIDKGVVCFLPGSQMQTPFFLTGDTQDPNRKLKQGDLILVQGIREAQKTKQPAVTTKVSVSNRFFVLALGSNKTNFSTKLAAQRKAEIKAEVCCGKYFDEDGNMLPWSWIPKEECENLDRFPPVGLIVRTECREVTSEILRSALDSLVSEFFTLLNTALYRSVYTCLRKPPSPWQDAINHFVLPEEYQEIVTDDRDLLEEMQGDEIIPAGKKIRYYEDIDYPLEKLYSLSSKLEGALTTRVWLKSGAYLIIEPTEALTVIDVNSGKFEAQKGEKDYYRAINMEAAEEIAFQIRLRNLSGMILVDFINMSDPQDHDDLIKVMQHLLQRDRVKTCVVDITKLGLMEITRMKTVPPLWEQARKYKYPMPKKLKSIE